MKKWHKLAVLGSIVFVLVLFVVLSSSGFFNREPPRRPAWSKNVSVTEREVFIEDNGFNIGELNTPLNTLLVLRVMNNDSKHHSVIFLGKKEEGEFEVLDRGVVESGGFLEKRFLSYNAEEETGSQRLFFDSLLFSCTTCTGENSQVKIVLEE